LQKTAWPSGNLPGSIHFYDTARPAFDHEHAAAGEALAGVDLGLFRSLVFPDGFLVAEVCASDATRSRLNPDDSNSGNPD